MFKFSFVTLMAFQPFLFLQTSVAQVSATPPPAANVATSDREIYIDPGRAGVRKLRLAIPYFGFVPNPVSTLKLAPSDTESYTNRLSEILNFTGSVEVLPQSGYLPKDNPTLRPPKYDEWTAINSEMLILVKTEATAKNSLTFEMSLFDTKKQKRLLGKRFSNIDKKDVDRVLRRFADLVIEALTGELGIFSSKIAFVGAPAFGQPRQLYLANFDGTELQQITKENAITMSPAWSPDGRKLAYTSFKGGKPDIYVYDLVTKRTIKLTQGIGANSGANWSPDGKTIVFTSMVNGVTSIYTMNATNGSGRKQIITSSGGIDVEPSFSPDGTKLAFVSARFQRPHVFVRDLATGQDTRITFAGWYNTTPSWRPDGRKLLFAGFDKEIDRYDVFLVNPDGRQMERLTLDQGDNEKPSWSPDGRFLVFASNRTAVKGKKGARRLHIMTRDGADQRALPINLGDVHMPAWGPRLNELGD